MAEPEFFVLRCCFVMLGKCYEACASFLGVERCFLGERIHTFWVQPHKSHSLKIQRLSSCTVLARHGV